MILNELCNGHPCLLREIWNITVRRTTWTYVVVPGCVRWRRLVWFCIGKPRKKKPRKENEKQLINDFGRDTSVSTALLTMKLLWSCMVDTLLNTFLFARCIFASINFELATTIAFCLVCLVVTTSNENEHTRSTWNPFSFRRDLYLIQFYSSLTNLTLLSMDLT